MLGRAEIMARIPHQGASCLIETCSSWSTEVLRAHTMAHLCADNPYRYGGRLDVLVGAEMAMQAAALHGALTGSQTCHKGGYLAALRDLLSQCDRLDCPGSGPVPNDGAGEQHDSAAVGCGVSIESDPGSLLPQWR